jgi:hypothetical protein
LQRRHVREVVGKRLQHRHSLLRVRVEDFTNTRLISAPSNSGSGVAWRALEAEPWPPREFDVEHAADEAFERGKVLQIDGKAVLKNQTVKDVGVQRQRAWRRPWAGSDCALSPVDHG